MEKKKKPEQRRETCVYIPRCDDGNKAEDTGECDKVITQGDWIENRHTVKKAVTKSEWTNTCIIVVQYIADVLLMRSVHVFSGTDTVKESDLGDTNSFTMNLDTEGNSWSFQHLFCSSCVLAGQVCVQSRSVWFCTFEKRNDIIV